MFVSAKLYAASLYRHPNREGPLSPVDLVQLEEVPTSKSPEGITTTLY